MALDRTARIAPGEIWEGKGGMGPIVRIDGIDLETAKVHYTRRGDNTHPNGSSDIKMFVQSFRPRPQR